MPRLATPNPALTDAPDACVARPSERARRAGLLARGLPPLQTRAVPGAVRRIPWSKRSVEGGPVPSRCAGSARREPAQRRLRARAWPCAAARGQAAPASLNPELCPPTAQVRGRGGAPPADGHAAPGVRAGRRARAAGAEGAGGQPERAPPRRSGSRAPPRLPRALGPRVCAAPAGHALPCDKWRRCIIYSILYCSC